MTKIKPELVCPAGDYGAMVTAVDSGADSVYFGIKGLNMRAKAGNFDILQLPKAMDYLHKHNKKGFLALNVMVMNHQLEKMEQILLKAKEAGVDGVVCVDMAVMAMAKELGLNIHLSTQASVSNSRALEYYASLGFRRAVLARECTLEQIKEMVETVKKKKIPIEIEAFVHGAMCVSVSGRCFLSSYTFGRSANQGECRQPCRREFVIKDTDGESEYILGNDHVMSPKDLCTIEFIDRLIDSGIHAFKIEGRMRSVEYIKLAVSAYREAIDAYFENKLTDELKKKLLEQLGQVYNRRFSSGFYFGRPHEWQTVQFEKTYDKHFVGEVINFYKKLMVAEVIVRKDPVKVGDRLLFTGSKTPASFSDVTELQQFHKPVQEAKRGEAVAIKVPFLVRRNDQVFVWKEKPVIE